MDADVRAAARHELARRAQAEIEARRNTPEYKADVRRLILAGLHAKQLEVVEALEGGQRFLTLCCSRRAGKTYLLASLIVLKLLDAGFNQAVLFCAPTLSKGKDLIWGEVTKLIRRFHLGWTLKEHAGVIETPSGASFHILGLNKRAHAEKPRGFDVILFLTDESQEYEYLLQPLLAAVGPALSGRRGCFLAAGTPGPALDGTWYRLVHGGDGFVNKGWTILENTKNPRPGEEVLREVLVQKGWHDQHPEFLREYRGLWVPDTNLLVCDFSPDAKNNLTILPEDYGLHWRHVIGIDIGHRHASAWTVLAVNPFTGERIVVHAEKHAGLIGDREAEITAGLVKQYATTYVVCDPGGGGVKFFETFNSKYGPVLNCQIRGANKVDKSGQIHLLNTELRTGRLKLLRPNADCLAKELLVLRWKDETRKEILEGPDYPDDSFDSLRYALVETVAWRSKEPPKLPAQAMSDDERARQERMKRQAAKGKQAWWQKR